ncbi:SLAC1 anion channel family protein [Candidatus Symbiobacter mobilis]|uniref:TDT family tellurite resistance protein n=1 Tax=Candidatus Symbiobacter mobilis CR TaxID=946483 RepID=U5N5X5_9BURK|nr:SLAC1 anion channel family protein [Candidatus Symbiobacter mobilis]AGX86767.1 TDT family tellurite resistance protein [Candidatus Symbiobacter mobilis CR]
MSDSSARLAYFPVSFFSIVMGLAGMAIAVQRAQSYLGLPGNAGTWLALFAALVFTVLACVFVLQCLRYPQEVTKELAHPIKLSFFPTLSISLLLLSIALEALSHDLSLWLLALGAPLQLGFTLFVMSRWIGLTHFEVVHSNPSWFIPVVGNILVPVAAVSHGCIEVSWFFFSIGLVFWLVLLTIILNRVIFHHPLPEKLLPTFFILIAPPAVGFIAYVKLTGDIDAFARILYYTACFTVLLLISLKKFLGFVRFYLSWWAYSFPLAAFTIASILMYHRTGQSFFQGVAWLMFVVVSVVVAGLTARTLLGIARREFCVDEESHAPQR